MKKIFALMLVSSFLFTTHVAFASWWNPFTWFEKTIPVVQPNGAIMISPSTIVQPVVPTPVKNSQVSSDQTPQKSIPKNPINKKGVVVHTPVVIKNEIPPQNNSVTTSPQNIVTPPAPVQVSPKPVKSNDQICTDTYGINSVWSNTLNTQGGAICNCKSGYEWNGDQSSCSLLPPATPTQLAGLTSLCNLMEAQDSSSTTSQECISGEMLSWYNSNSIFRAKMDSLVQTLQQKQQNANNNYLNTQQQLQQEQTTYKLQQLQNSIDANATAIKQQQQAQQQAQYKQEQYQWQQKFDQQQAQQQAAYQAQQLQFQQELQRRANCGGGALHAGCNY